MKHLFSTDGERALATVMQLDPILAFDFDGTLAPIVAHPGDARVADAVSRKLAALAERLGVAIITGRDVADVRPRLGFEPRWIIGNHGAEEPSAALPLAAREALTQLRRRCATEASALSEAGIKVEDKHLSLAFHYRRAPDSDAALRRIDALLHGMPAALARFGGKCVVNVVAAGLPDKGEALVRLVQRAQAAAAVFFGDDVNDEAVFARAEPPWLTVRIGCDAPQSRAMFCLDHDTELARVLERMLMLRKPA